MKSRFSNVRRRTRFGVISGVAMMGAVVGIGIYGVSSTGASSQFVPVTIPVGGPAPVIPAPPLAPGSLQVAPTVQTPAPSVVASGVECTASEITANLAGSGPYGNGDEFGQSIIDLTSSTSCYVSGFPTLEFVGTDGSAVSVATIDGGYQGTAQPTKEVTLGPTTQASFLFQSSELSSVGCAMESMMSVQIGNLLPFVSVNLNGVGLNVCGSVNVTPVIQGDESSRYI
jgi:hypothetical protein